MVNLQSNLDKMQRLQEQMSSGKSLNKPSDAPADAASALRYRSEIRRSEQHARNASDGLGWLGEADTALNAVVGITHRVKALALQGANGTSGPIEREALAAEVDVLRANALGLANTTYLDRPIFGGTSASPLAYDAAGAFVGDAGQIKRSVANGTSVRVNLTGPEAFNVPGPPATDLFAVLADVAAALRSGDQSTLVSTDVVTLEKVTDKMQNALSTLGARTNQVETLRQRSEDGAMNLSSSLAEVESVDLPRTIVEMQMQEVAYKAAISTTARVLQPSLVDFLR